MEKKTKSVYNYCPFCEKRIFFTITMDDIDTTQYPAPAYIIHKDESCNKLATFYFDSLLRVSYKETEKKSGGTTEIEAKTIKKAFLKIVLSYYD